jgi:hypothetical protein
LSQNRQFVIYFFGENIFNIGPRAIYFKDSFTDQCVAGVENAVGVVEDLFDPGPLEPQDRRQTSGSLIRWLVVGVGIPIL